ncbi:TRAF3-interacting protein 1 [Operophtera brumata]|uniref:TRAF3-interacting protein 1 n=1 Tax=Operophtera brumata TaxID=104452 RepID=A0A0L7LEW4_OPEBR|nr:TRAF3-interacting protein 1 [Operophtera brumata]
MEKELGADVIKATQASLGKYVKRPPLSEKLLRKPPFRFLHDIVSAVHKTTGFFEGLFEEGELISENVKDRDSKIIFLNKVITVIGTTTGKSLTVKSSKIVAGQEPDKTNELLQCLALALDKKLSSDEAVKKYKESAKAPISTEVKPKEKDTSKTAKKSNDAKKLPSKSSEKLTTNKKELGTVIKSDTKTNSDSKTKRKEINVVKNDIQLKKSLQPSNKKTVAVTNKVETLSDLKVNQSVVEKEEKHTENNKIEDIEQLNLLSKTENTKTNDDQINTTTEKSLIIQSNDQELQGKLSSSSYTIGENENNSSLSSQDEVENIGKSTGNVAENADDIGNQYQVNHNQDTFTVKESKTLPIKSIKHVLSKDEFNDSVDKSDDLEKRRIVDKVVTISSRRNNSDVMPPSARPSSSRPGAPRVREKTDNVITNNDNLLLAKVNIIAESANNEEEEDTVIVVEQHTSDESTLDNQHDQLQLSSSEHGHLVQQILDSQKEFSQVGKTEIEWQFGAQKVKEAVNQEIEQLRFNIQALSRVANPLGKLLDHIQEDAELCGHWIGCWDFLPNRKTNCNLNSIFLRRRANEETLVPLQTRIKQLDVDIQEKHDKIDDHKILIHKNALRIEKLLTNGNVQ